MPLDPADWSPGRYRRLGAALLVCLLVTTAGCSALGLNSNSPTRTAASPTTSRPTTTTQQTTATPTTDGGSGATSTTTASTDAATGRVAVVVAGERVSLVDRVGSEAGQVWMDADAPDTWHAAAQSNLTVAMALSAADISVTDSRLAIDGHTYAEGSDGTAVSVRVDGEPVDPQSYHLEDGDELWVTVETASMNASAPGTYIDEDRLHIHGHMNLTVNGTQVDFGRSKYQSRDHYFHFEGGDSEPWHAHSATVPLGYALATLPGINATDHSVTYENRTYEASDPGTSVTVEVNGESVDPSSYYLKDGDSVHVVVDTNK